MAKTENARITTEAIRHLADDESLPPSGVITVSLQRLRDERDAILARGAVGLRLRSTETAADAAPVLADVELVVLEFPTFNDGRPYTTARLLREKYGYAGELRAAGDVLRDQLFYMQRCGFDVLELRADKDAGSAVAALDELSVTYQTAADARLPVYLQRRS